MIARYGATYRAQGAYIGTDWQQKLIDKTALPGGGKNEVVFVV